MRPKYDWFLLVSFLLSVLLIAGQDSNAAHPATEVIDFGDFLATNSSHVYYNTAGTPDISCNNDPNLVYGRVPLGLGESDKETLQTGCDTFGMTAMVASDSHIYYIARSGLFGRHDLFRRPLNGDEPEEQLTNISGVEPRMLTIDNDYVYFVLLESMPNIQRFDLVTGDIEFVSNIVITAEKRLNHMTVDSSHVYWTEGDEVNPGLVRRVDKNGGILESIASNRAYPWDIVIDGSYVYWTELDGRLIARRFKSGFGDIETIYNGQLPVQTLVIDGNDLYLGEGRSGTQSGAIKRTSINGVGAVTLEFDIGAPKDIFFSNDFIYWVDGRFKRIQKDTQIAGVDYQGDRIEVTQGIQDGFNSVPLVSAKPTYVRFYASEASGGSGSAVRAVLHGFDGNSELPGSPLLPVQNATLDLPGNVVSRGETDLSYLFLLPPRWTTVDDLKLQAELNPGPSVYEDDISNNLFPSIPQPFSSEARRTCLVTYPVAAVDSSDNVRIYGHPDESAAQADAYYAQMDRAETILPMLLTLRPDDTELWIIDPEAIEFEPFDLSTAPDRGTLMSLLQATADNSDPPAGCTAEKTIYAGLVHPGADTFDSSENFLYGGQGNPAGMMWSKMWVNPDGGFEDYNQPRGAFTIAHEIGHVYNRAHVDCSGPADPDPNYPYNPCQIDDSSDENAHWGFDPITWQALDPTTEADLMSYQYPKWVSDYTWEGIYDTMGDLNSTAEQSVRANLPAQDELLIYIPVIKDDLQDGIEESAILPSFQFPSENNLTDRQLNLLNSNNPQGSLLIVLRDRFGDILASKSFDPDPNDDDDTRDRLNRGRTVMPFDPQTREIALIEKSSGQDIATRQVSANPPVAQITGLTVGDFRDQIKVSWEASDADKDTLYVIGRHELDSGRISSLFTSLEHTGEEASWEGSTATLPGGRGYLRLYITDGVYTVMIQERAFIRLKAPRAYIHPVTPQILYSDQAITLSGSAYDYDDGRIPDDRLQWVLNGQPVGQGYYILLDPLPPGQHTIKLEVRDISEMTAEFSRQIIVQEKPEPSDSDNDGVPDTVDNCVDVPNNDQIDTNSVEDDNTSVPGDQHYGNACDADYDNDGTVGLSDFNVLRTWFGESVPPAPAYIDCDGDDTIGLGDFNCLRTYFGKAPGPGLGD